MPTSDLLGPAGALAFAIVVVGLIIKGELVPGFIYRRTEARADKAEAALIEVLSKSKPDDGKDG